MTLSLPLYHEIVTIFFFRFEALQSKYLSLSLMPAPSKCKCFELNFRSWMLKFRHCSILHEINSLKYFQTFSRTVEAPTQATRTSDTDITMSRSRGCIACHYLICTVLEYNAPTPQRLDPQPAVIILAFRNQLAVAKFLKPIS